MDWEMINTIFMVLLIYEIVRAILRAVLVVFLRRCFPSIYMKKLGGTISGIRAVL